MYQGLEKGIKVSKKVSRSPKGYQGLEKVSRSLKRYQGLEKGIKV
jgi:hypothetical protein